MSALLDLLMGVFRQPTLGGVALELASLAAPLWLAALVGLLIGWAWRPRWALVVVGEAPPPPRAAAEDSCRKNELVAVVPRTAMAAAAPEEGTLLEAMQALPARDRAVLHLYYYEGYQTAEIAALTGLREGSVRSRLTRARTRLRQVLKGEDE